MPAYNYRAVNPAGRIAQGQIAAANEHELFQRLHEAGLELIAARAKSEHAMHVPTFARSNPRMLAELCSQMSDLLLAGLPFREALKHIVEAGDTGAMHNALSDIARAIDHGGRLSESFARFPQLFSSLFTSILAAGEASGDLPQTFARLARYTETQARTREQLGRALRYPLFLLLIASGAIVFMMTQVVPQIVEFLGSIDGELPLSTKILITVSNIVAMGWWMVAGALVGAAFIATIMRRNSADAARWIDGIILRMPIIGAVIRKIAVARFMQNFSLLFESGLGVIGSLRAARATTGNYAIEAMLVNAEKLVMSGQPLSAAMEGILPAFSLRIIRVGEQSGKLAKGLADIATTQEREMARITERFIGSLEPALTLGIGILLAWIVLAVLGPIYGGLGKLGASG
jgi:type IV pilus assembly protein PilC